MIEETESEYFRRRAGIERAAANSAQTKRVGALHREIAALYERHACDRELKDS